MCYKSIKHYQYVVKIITFLYFVILYCGRKNFMSTGIDKNLLT